MSHPQTRAEYLNRISTELATIRSSGLWKNELQIVGPQGPLVNVIVDTDDDVKPRSSGGGGKKIQTNKQLINMCANNYLGLSANRTVVAAAAKGMKEAGFGMSSVRFICGTNVTHRQLEQQFAQFLGKQDSMLFSSCFDANTGLFEVLLKKGDCVVSDQLIHASLIDGLRLTKCTKLRYKNNDMADLKLKLQQAQKEVVAKTGGAIIIVTDGVFSMDGEVCDLKALCDLADEFEAIVVVDDSHATGLLGPGGRGTPELFGVQDRVHIITTTLGKALGGAAGGLVAGPKPIIDLLRQRARTSLFSNSLPPAIVAATKAVLQIVQSKQGPLLRNKVEDNSKYLRHKLELAGFTLRGAKHAIIPIMVGDAAKAAALSRALFQRGIFAVAFSFPVVPKGEARVRVQLSAAHDRAMLDAAIAAFVSAGVEVGLLPDTRKQRVVEVVKSKL